MKCNLPKGARALRKAAYGSAFMCLAASCLQVRPASAQDQVDPLPDRRVDLRTVMNLAASRSLRLAVSRSETRQASGHLLGAYEGLVPSLLAETYFNDQAGQVQSTEGAFLDVTKQSARAGGRIQLSWDLGESIFQIQTARRQHDAARHRSEWVSNSVAKEVGLAYLDLVRASAEIDIAERAIQVSADLVRQMGAGIISGVAYRADMLRARSQLAQDSLLHHRGLLNRLAASERLERLLNLPPGEILWPVDSLGILLLVDTTLALETWVDKATGVHPALAERAAVLSAMRASRNAALWGPLIPEIRADWLYSGFGRSYSELGSSNHFAIGVRWTVGPGGLLDAGRNRTASAAAEIAGIRLESAADSIREEVRVAFGQMQSQMQMLAIARHGLEDADQALSLSLERQGHGIGLPLEVIDAAESRSRAELAYAQAATEFTKAQIGLLAAAGEASLLAGAPGAANTTE